MHHERKYWFPAKRYGWGWGIPATWQGWLVLGIYVALLAAGAFFFRPHREVSSFVLYVVVCSALLVAVCWLKGEPPRWHWGGK